jgi:hypothetical protein
MTSLASEGLPSGFPDRTGAAARLTKNSFRAIAFAILLFAPSVALRRQPAAI